MIFDQLNLLRVLWLSVNKEFFASKDNHDGEQNEDENDSQQEH